MATTVGVVLPRDVLRQLDEARGLVPRSTWIREAVKNALEREGGGHAD